jgi:hypothetical protein
VPEDSRMMEKEDAEQTSEEERKNLDEEKQRTAGEKLNEELIDLALKLQDIGKQRKVANILNEESYQKLKQIGDQLFQVELDITERIGKPEPVGRVDEIKELLVAEEGQMEIFNDISRIRKEIEEDNTIGKGLRLWVFNDTFNSILVLSCMVVILLVEETVTP